MLTSCPECRGKLSSSAASCPACGYVLRRAAATPAASGASDEPPKPRAGGGCATSALKTAVGIVILAAAGFGVAYCFFGDKSTEAVRNLARGQVVHLDQDVDIPAHDARILPFIAAPGGVLDLTLEMRGGGEVNVRVMDAEAHKKAVEAKESFTSGSLKHHPSLAADDVKRTKTITGKLAAGPYHLVVQNDNLLGGVKLHVKLAQDFTR